MASRQFVVFRINDEDFALDIDKVKEIVKPLEIARVPNVPDFIEGMVNMRGKVHAVINMRSKLSMPKKAFDESTKIIFVNVCSMLAGVVVDGVTEIIRVEEEEIDSTPEMISKVKMDYITGVIKRDKKMVMIINVDRVIDAAA